MKRHNILTLLLAFSLAVVLAACGGDDGNEDKDKEEKEVEVETEVVEEDEDEDEDEDEKEEPEEEEKEKDDDIAEDEVFNPAIAEETEGNVEVVYTNDDADLVNEVDGFTISADAYQIVKVTDMNKPTSERFGDEDGYIMTTKASIENDTDMSVQYSIYMNIQMEDKYDYLSSNEKDFIPEEHQLSWDDDVGVYKPGDKKEFWLTTRITTEEFERLDDLEPKFVIEGEYRDAEDDDSSIVGEDKVFSFVYNEDQAEDVADSDELYPDKLTTDNIAKKELLFEDNDINKSDDLEGFEVTVEGVQFAEITPNDSSEARFENFDGDDIVAVTVHLTMDNDSDEMVTNPLTGWLNVNDGEAKLQASGLVDGYSDTEIKPGDTGEHYMVFLMKEKYYDIYESYELEVGPFFGEDSYIFKEHEMNFDIPHK